MNDLNLESDESIWKDGVTLEPHQTQHIKVLVDLHLDAHMYKHLYEIQKTRGDKAIDLTIIHLLKDSIEHYYD